MAVPGLIPGTATTGMSAEETIARQVIHQVLPGLEDLLFVLGRLQKVWNTSQNAIPAKIEAAARAGQALASYSPNDWVRWGQALKKLEVNLQEPFTIVLPDGSKEDVTLESVLLTRYTPMEVAQ